VPPRAQVSRGDGPSAPPTATRSPTDHIYRSAAGTGTASGVPRPGSWRRSSVQSAGPRARATAPRRARGRLTAAWTLRHCGKGTEPLGQVVLTAGRAQHAAGVVRPSHALLKLSSAIIAKVFVNRHCEKPLIQPATYIFYQQSPAPRRPPPHGCSPGSRRPAARLRQSPHNRRWRSPG